MRGLLAIAIGGSLASCGTSGQGSGVLLGGNVPPGKPAASYAAGADTVALSWSAARFQSGEAPAYDPQLSLDGGKTWIDVCGPNYLDHIVITTSCTTPSRPTHRAIYRVLASCRCPITLTGPESDVTVEGGPPVVQVLGAGTDESDGLHWTYTATVEAEDPTGTVTFSDSGHTIATCSEVALSGDTATCSQIYTNGRHHSITATYNGNAELVPSISPVFSV